MNVVFTSPVPQRNSAQVLGVQTSEALRATGFSALFLPFYALDKVFNETDIIVFCKFYDLELMRCYHEAGKKVIWFPDESIFGPDISAALQHQDILDCVISTCDKYTEKLAEIGFSHPLVEVIHHHHCNFSSDTVPFREKVTRVAYVGEPTQMHHKEGVKRLCNELGAEFVLKDEKTKDLKDFEDIDIALAFIDPDSKNEGLHVGEKNWQERLDYRSNAKIVNHAAFGIPAILSRYASYVEVANPYDKFCLFVDTPDELENELRRLIGDVDLRKRLRANGLAMRDDYHILNLQNRYKEVFEIVSKG